MDDIHLLPTPVNSLARIQKAKICSSLLHRIRMIQGHTSLNFAEPHFVESNASACLLQTKDMIANLTGDLKRAGDGSAFSSDTNADVNNAEKRHKANKDDTKRSKRKPRNLVRNIVNFYEYGKAIDDSSNVKLSQIFTEDKVTDNHGDHDAASSVSMQPGDQSETKTRKKRKRDQNAKPDTDVSFMWSKKTNDDGHANVRSIADVVSSTISRLDNAKQSVQKVINGVKSTQSETTERPQCKSAENKCVKESPIILENRPKTSKRKSRKSTYASGDDTTKKQTVPKSAQKGILCKLKTIKKKAASVTFQQQSEFTQTPKSPKTENKEINVDRGSDAEKVRPKSGKRKKRKQSGPKPRPCDSNAEEMKPTTIDEKSKTRSDLSTKSDAIVDKSVEIDVDPIVDETSTQNNQIDNKSIQNEPNKNTRDICKQVSKKTNKTLATLNEQMSNTLKESIAHLNEICSRVRNCLSDIEKDEINYKKQKAQKSYQESVASESVFDLQSSDLSMVSLQTNVTVNDGDKSCTYQLEEIEFIPNPVGSKQSNEISCVIPALSAPTTVEHLVTTVNLDQSSLPDVIGVGSAKKKSRTKRRLKKFNGKKLKTNASSKLAVKESNNIQKASLVKLPSTISKHSEAKIPIWDRKPPSVIEEVQLTVKKQATKSQYRDFIRTLRNLSAKHKSSTIILPKHEREAMQLMKMEKQMDSRCALRSPQKPAKKIKDMKSPVDGMKPKTPKSCAQCLPGKCTCGVTVENVKRNVFGHRMRPPWIRTASDLVQNKTFQAYDILDEITLKDVEPIQSEYPRKDNLDNGHRSIEDTLLYKLVYDEDPKILETLLKSSTFIEEKRTLAPFVHQQRPRTAFAVGSKDKMCNRPKSASNAYRMYERFEFNDKSTINLAANKGNLSLNRELVVVPPKATIKKPRAAPLQTCTKKFDDDLAIPATLKPEVGRVDAPPPNCKRKFCQVKMLADGAGKKPEEKHKKVKKASSMKNVKRHKGKFSKEIAKANLRPYTAVSNYKMKNVITVVPVMVESYAEKYNMVTRIAPNATNLERNGSRGKEEIVKIIQAMSKNEIIKRLKPYIFANLDPPVLTVMPVTAKYNFINNQNLKSNNQSPKSTNKLTAIPKDHGDDCHSGKRLCRKCQMAQECRCDAQFANDPVVKRMEHNTIVRPPLNQKQLLSNKYRKTPVENLVSLIERRSGTKYPIHNKPIERPSNSKTIGNIMREQLNNTAANTRLKLEEVRKMVNENYLGRDMENIIYMIELKIIDILSNPKQHRGNAFSEIEKEIKNVLDTINHRKGLTDDTFDSDAKTSSNLIGEAAQSAPTETNLTKRSSQGIASHTKQFQIQEEGGAVVNEDRVDKTPMEANEFQKDIEKVINDLDVIINLNESTLEKEVEEQAELVKDIISKESTPRETTPMRTNVEDEGVVTSPAFTKDHSENVVSSFSKQVDEVIKEILQTEGNFSEKPLEVIHESPNEKSDDECMQSKKGDEFLTPFMKAVKTYRRKDGGQNFMDFLDELSDMSKENTSHFNANVSVYSATVQHISNTLETSKIVDQACNKQKVRIEKEHDVKRCPTEFFEVDEGNEDTFVKARQQPKEFKTEVKSPKIKTKNKRLQTLPWREGIADEEPISRNVQTSSTEIEYYEVEEVVDSLGNKPGVGTQETESKMNQGTQIPNEANHSCFADVSNRTTQVTDDLKLMCSKSIESQVTSDHLARPSRSISTHVESNELLVDGTHYKRHEQIDTQNKYTECGTGLNASISTTTMTVPLCNVQPQSPKETRSKSTATSEVDVKGTDEKIRSVHDNIISLYDCQNKSSLTFEANPSDLSGDICCFKAMRKFEENSPNDHVSQASKMSQISQYSVSKESSTSQVRLSNISFGNNYSSTLDYERDDVDQTGRGDHTSVVIHKSQQHKKLLNSVYGILFTIMFVGLNMQYVC